MDSFPQIVRCTLGQGGGSGYLQEKEGREDFASFLEARVTVVATNYEPIVRTNLAEPTRRLGD